MSDLPPDRDVFFAIAIEGIGPSDDTSGAQEGWLITDDGARPHLSIIESETTWTPKPWLNADSISVASVSQERFQSAVQWSRVSGALKANDQAAETFVQTQFTSAAVVDSRIMAGDSTIELSDGSLEGQVVYIGDETVALTNHTGGGTYDVIRGQYRSVALGHEAGEPVFTEPPYHDMRRLWFFSAHVDPNGAAEPDVNLEQRAVAFLVGNMVMDRGVLPIKTRQAGARLQEMEAGRESRKLDTDGAAFEAQAASDEPGFTMRGTSNGVGEDRPTRILKPDALEQASTTDGVVGAQIGEYVFPARAQINPIPSPATTQGVSVSEPSTRALFGETPRADDFELGGKEGDAVRPVTSAAYEVFVADRQQDVTPLKPIRDALSIPDIEWHPLAYVAAFCFSTRQSDSEAQDFDILTPDWSLNAGWLFVDTIVTDIKGLILEYPQQIDELELGAGGEPVDLWEFCVDELLVPWGWALNITSQGLLEIDRMRPPTVADHDEALGRPVEVRSSDVLTQDPARDRTAYGIEATVGGGELRDGRSLIVRYDDDLNQRWLDFQGRRSVEVDFSTLQAKRATGSVADRLADMISVQAYPNPRLTFLAPDQRGRSADYDIGEFINLEGLNVEPAWWVDSTGERTESLSDIEATGLIVGRHLIIGEEDRTLGYQLTVMFLGRGITRWRAPSAKIQSATTVNGGADHQLTVGADGAGVSHYGAVDASGSVPDASFFTAGDEIEVRNPDFTAWTNSAIREVQSVDVGNNTVTVEGTWAADPPAGRFVELAHLETDGGGGYVNNGLGGELPNIGRVYMYLSDESDTLGDADISGDRYGM